MGNGRLPQKSFQASLRLISTLRCNGKGDATAESCVRSKVLAPIIDALRKPEPAESPHAAVLTAVPCLGSLTSEVLSELGLTLDDSSQPERWSAARAELRRQAMLRRWVAWDEVAESGLLART